MSIQPNPDPELQPKTDEHTVRGVIAEIVWGALFVIIVFGGIGWAFYNSEIPLPGAQPTAAPLSTPSTQQLALCAGDGCMTDPGNGCGQPPIRAVAVVGAKLYFTADHPAYVANKTLDPQRGDRWFCTTAQAEAAGFHAAP